MFVSLSYCTLTALCPGDMKLSWDNGSLGLDYPGCMSVVAIYFFIQVVYFHIYNIYLY